MREDELSQYFRVARCARREPDRKCIREVHRSVDISDTGLKGEGYRCCERKFSWHVGASENEQMKGISRPTPAAKRLAQAIAV